MTGLFNAHNNTGAIADRSLRQSWDLLYSIGKVLLGKEILIKYTSSKIDQVGLDNLPGYSTGDV